MNFESKVLNSTDVQIEIFRSCWSLTLNTFSKVLKSSQNVTVELDVMTCHQ